METAERKFNSRMRFRTKKRPESSTQWNEGCRVTNSGAVWRGVGARVRRWSKSRARSGAASFMASGRAREWLLLLVAFDKPLLQIFPGSRRQTRKEHAGATAVVGPDHFAHTFH